jgi:peroxiredoxin
MGPDGKPDQILQYKYYLKHFFDYIDFSDGALVRTPLIHTKLNQFFSNVVPGHPDSVIRYVDKIIDLAEADPEMFQFTVQYLLNHYSQPKIMGMDAVYVHIGENYYMNGRAHWVSDQNLDLIRTRVKTLKPLLIGAPAPPLQGMETPDSVGIHLNDIEAKLIILYFWEPDCSFCKTATPKLMGTYRKFKDRDVVVLAVNTRLDVETWKSFIAEHELTWMNVYSPHNIRSVLTNYDAYSTPKLFILDSDKKIAAKDIGVEQIDQVIEHLLEN